MIIPTTFAPDDPLYPRLTELGERVFRTFAAAEPEARVGVDTAAYDPAAGTAVFGLYRKRSDTSYTVAPLDFVPPERRAEAAEVLRGVVEGLALGWHPGPATAYRKYLGPYKPVHHGPLPPGPGPLGRVDP